jgi:hypothetical protein
MISSTMQDFPLTIGAIMRHGARVYGASECVTRTGAGARRTSYADGELPPTAFHRCPASRKTECGM